VEEVNEVNNRRFHTLFNRVRNISHARFTNFSALLSSLPSLPTRKSSHDCIHRWVRRSVYHLGELHCSDHPYKFWNFKRAGRKRRKLHSVFWNFRLSARVRNCPRWDQTWFLI